MKIYNNMLELIGKTPLVKLNNMDTGEAEVLVKVESFNPGGSVKDRIALAMIEDAEREGIMHEDSVIIEPTSGNTGIGLAMVAAIKGYKLILTMPDTMSLERRNLLKAYGAELVLTPGANGMRGAIEKAKELEEEYEHAFIPQQFQNAANPEVHRKTTALEILNDTDGKVDAFVAGVGTGGTITGVGEVLKEKKSDTQILAIEPSSSAVLSGNKPGPHKIQGIGAGFVPQILNTEIYDEVLQIEDKDAFHTADQLAKKEGILVGISSGAAVYAALQLAKQKEYSGKRIVVLLPDTGHRYLSMDLFQ